MIISERQAVDEQLTEAERQIIEWLEAQIAEAEMAAEHFGQRKEWGDAHRQNWKAVAWRLAIDAIRRGDHRRTVSR